jgi:hypothetical protein
VFARDAEPMRHDGLRIHRGLTHHLLRDQHFRGAYNQRNERFDLNPQFQRNTDNSGFRGRDPSRIGGEDPDLHPSAYLTGPPTDRSVAARASRGGQSAVCPKTPLPQDAGDEHGSTGCSSPDATGTDYD